MKCYKAYLSRIKETKKYPVSLRAHVYTYTYIYVIFTELITRRLSCVEGSLPETFLELTTAVLSFNSI